MGSKEISFGRDVVEAVVDIHGNVDPGQYVLGTRVWEPLTWRWIWRRGDGSSAPGWKGDDGEEGDGSQASPEGRRLGASVRQSPGPSSPA